MGAVPEDPLGWSSQYWDIELESVIILELVSLHATGPMRQNEPRDLASKSLRQKIWHARTDFPVSIEGASCKT